METEQREITVDIIRRQAIERADSATKAYNDRLSIFIEHLNSGGHFPYSIEYDAESLTKLCCIKQIRDGVVALLNKDMPIKEIIDEMTYEYNQIIKGKLWDLHSTCGWTRQSTMSRYHALMDEYLVTIKWLGDQMKSAEN